MRKTLLFLFLFVTNVAIAQVKDDFSDGNFSVNPVWGGNTDRFVINPNFLLQSNGQNSANQNIYLSTPSTAVANTVWEFFIRLNFDPTTTNFPRVYLVSNQENLSGALNGYFFQIGETGARDAFNLFKQNGSTTSRIIAGQPKDHPSSGVVSARIKVTRDNAGKWQLYADLSGGTNYIFDGEATDNTHTVSTFFGVNCRYATASRFDQFFFDDFDVKALAPDVVAPTLLNVAVADSKTLTLTFNEPLSAATALNVANYKIGTISPNVASFGTLNNTVTLTFANDFNSGPSTLITTNIADIAGNVANAMAKPFTYIKPYTAVKGDIIINEIFADPSPVVGLPDKEFIEIYNTTNEYIVITGWRLKDGAATGTPGTLAADTLAPKEYRILCASADVALYKPFGKTTGLSGWPSLNNDTDDLKLMLPDATTIIDQVVYADTWYGDDVKKQGGYTLELITPMSACTGAANWRASVATTGGTPGAQNSIYQAQPDLTAPKLLSATITSLTNVTLFFDKYLDVTSAEAVSNYTVNNSVGSPASAVLSADGKSVALTFATAFARGLENTITIQNVNSCAGTLIDLTANKVVLFLAKEIQVGDILISEILFNERTGGAEFVEIYNASNNVLDLKDLKLSNANYTGANDKKTLTGTSIFMQPKSYWVLSRNPDAVKADYEVLFPNQMLQVAGMSATFFTNAAGSAMLWAEDKTIDVISYTENMHHALLKEVKGVSLERVSFAKSGNEVGNLQSAAATSGYATPTAPNSQAEDPSIKNTFKVSNKTFSPDNDGFEDLLNIDYQFKENGNLATINIYTDKGVLVRKLARNISFSTKGTVTWDGLNDGGQFCKVGIYLITAEILNPRGNVERFKQTCVLAAKLN